MTSNFDNLMSYRI